MCGTGSGLWRGVLLGILIEVAAILAVTAGILAANLILAR